METNNNQANPKPKKDAFNSLPSLGNQGMEEGVGNDALEATGELFSDTDVTNSLPLDKIRAAAAAQDADKEQVATPAPTASKQAVTQEMEQSIPTPAPVSAAAPAPKPEPVVAPAPKPEPVAAQTPKAEPVAAPEPAAAQTPKAEPAPTPKPTRTPSPASIPTPEFDDEYEYEYVDEDDDDSRIEAEYISSGAQPIMEPMGMTRKGGRGGKMIVLGIFAFLLVVYVAVAIFFTSHFLPNTTVNGDDVSGTAIADLASNITNTGMSYKTHVKGDGIDLEIAGQDIGVSYDGESYAKAAADQYSAWTWPVGIFQTHNITVDQGIALDESSLEAMVDPQIAQINESATPPTNANMTYDANKGQFVELNDKLGTQIDRETTMKTIKEGVRTLQDEIVLGDEELVQPTLRVGDQKLTDGIDHANQLASKSIVLRVSGTDAATIDGNLMSQWLSLNDQGQIEVNKDAIVAWSDSELATRFDTVATKRTYTRPDGKVVEVEGGDLEYSYGWNIDGETLSETIVNNLKSDNLEPIDVPMLQQAAKWNPGGQEWPNRYIDVDISEQTVRMYDDNSALIFESPCVSGEPQYDGGTHQGVFYIYTKCSPMELVGLDYNGDGEPDYRTNVTFWMPFDGGEGLHDMATRGAFGGDIYLYNGSHGCVNLPYYSAAELYEITEVGDVVIVHE